MTDRLRVRISGRVQGVGFRYTTVREAHALGLAGWVRNIPGGMVEAEFEGPREALETILTWCHQGPASAHVERVHTTWETGPALYESFMIR